MQRLIEGYREFRRQRWPAERARYEALARKGQNPEYLIIACSDSRSDPATIFAAKPGEFFVVRNIAATVPPYEEASGYLATRAAIAFAVLNLGVRNIVVMGHAQCGGVAAAMNPEAAKGTPFLGEWLTLLEPAVERVRKEGHDHGGSAPFEQAAVALSVERLLNYPFVAERVQRGELEVNGLRFGIADGKLEMMDRTTGVFAPLSPRAGLGRWFGGTG